MSAQGWAAFATVLYVTGLVALFGLRTWRHRKSTGSSGFNGFAGRDGWARAAGLLFAVAVLAGTVALILAAAGTTPVLTPRGLTQPLAVAGLLMAAAGLGLAWAAQSSMGTPGGSASTRGRRPSWSRPGCSPEPETRSSPPWLPLRQALC